MKSTIGKRQRVRISDSTKKQVLGRQQYRCANAPGSTLHKQLNGYTCPRWHQHGGSFDESGYQVDHIVEECLSGSSNDPSNLQALCLSCHGVKTDLFARSRAWTSHTVSSAHVPVVTTATKRAVRSATPLDVQEHAEVAQWCENLAEWHRLQQECQAARDAVDQDPTSTLRIDIESKRDKVVQAEIAYRQAQKELDDAERARVPADLAQKEETARQQLDETHEAALEHLQETTKGNALGKRTRLQLSGGRSVIISQHIRHGTKRWSKRSVTNSGVLDADLLQRLIDALPQSDDSVRLQMQWIAPEPSPSSPTP